MAAQSRSFLQVAATEEASPPLRVVQIEGLVLLKIVKHCQEFSPALVTGQLLGLDVGSVLEVTNCFPFPIREEDEEVEAEGANYQLEMMRCLREVNVDNNTVGWYQSTSFGSFQTVELIETFMNYQENIRRCVCIVYDPSRSNQGVLALKALKLSDSFMDLYKNNNFTGEKLREKNLSWADIFEEIPVNNFKEDEKDDCSDDYDNSDKDEYNNDGDDDHGNHDEDTDVESENEEEEGGGSENDNDDEQKDDEMEELEIEYKKLLNEEQDLSRNLKGHKDDDIKKGQAVKNQRALWDKTLEFRFLLQKAFSSSNRLPQEPVRSLFFDSDNGVSEAFSDLITSSKMTLDSILELQQALVENNPSIAQSVDANSLKDSKQSVAFGNLNGDVDEEWLHISQMHTRMTSFRNESIDKWQRKTQVTTGAAAIKGKLHAFNQNISEQVVAYMRDPSKMIKGMQQNRLDVAVFGNVAVSTNTTTREDTNANASGDHELLDDSEFYQQLLKEFFETIDPASSETTFYAMKRLQTKKRKIVDRRASKSRKIRYHVHEKIVNFMAPRPMNLSHDASMTFQNLFGLRIQKSASAV